MALNLNPKGPLMFGALALAGLWLASRASAGKTTPVQKAVQQGRKTYNTPQFVADLFGAAVAASTRGVKPSVKSEDNVVGFNWKPWGDQAIGAGQKWIDAQPQLGTFTFGAGMLDTNDAWKPQLSVVATDFETSGQSDGVAQGAVYDTTTDFKLNPYKDRFGAY